MPSLTIVVPKWLFEKHYNVNKCVVYINDIKFFSGTVELLETCDFLLTIKVKTIAKEINKNNISSSQTDKFK